MKRVEILLAIAVGCLIFMGYALADQYHPAEELRAGTFGTFAGGPYDYKFPGSLNVTNYLYFKGGAKVIGSLGGHIIFYLGKPSPIVSAYYIIYDVNGNQLLSLDNVGNLWVKGNVDVQGIGGNICHQVGGTWYSCPPSAANYWSLTGSNLYPNTGYNVGIGTSDPGTNKLKVAGNTEITSNLNVGGKTNIVNSKSTFDTWSSSGWDNVGECLQISPDTSYSAMAIMIRPDFYSDNGDASFWANSDCTGTKVGNMNFFIAAGGYTGPIGGPNYYYIHYTTFILPTTIKSIKIESRGDKGMNQEVTPNVVITAYFK